MIALQLRHRQRGGRRRDEATCQAREHHAVLGAGHADGHVSGKGERSDGDGHQPDLVRIERPERADLAIGKDLQEDHRHRQKHETRAQLLPGQPLEPAVQRGL
jgi:hypothetical protein